MVQNFLCNVFALKICFCCDALSASASISVTIKWLTASMNLFLFFFFWRLSCTAVATRSANTSHMAVSKWSWERETKELLLLCCGSNPLTWMYKICPIIFAVWCASYTQAHTRARFPPPCWLYMQRPRPHASFRLFSSQGAISNDLHWWYGTEAGRPAGGQARDVFCVCLVTGLSSVSCLGRRRALSSQLLPWAVCVLVALGLLLSLWPPMTFCVSMWLRCSGHVIYTQTCKKKQQKKPITLHHRTVALEELHKLDALFDYCSVACGVQTLYHLCHFRMQKRHFTESHQCNCQR